MYSQNKNTVGGLGLSPSPPPPPYVKMFVLPKGNKYFVPFFYFSRNKSLIVGEGIGRGLGGGLGYACVWWPNNIYFFFWGGAYTP